jgi:hypothetical protein
VDEVDPLYRRFIRGDVDQLLELLEIGLFVGFKLLVQVTIQLNVG